MYIGSENNPAGAFFKLKKQSYQDKSIESANLLHQVEQWTQNQDPIGIIGKEENGSVRKLNIAHVFTFHNS